MAARQPKWAVRFASSGRNANWPVAVLAARSPMTRPRRAENQRVATVAPSTIAVSPVPTPITTPHNRKSCHNRDIPSDRRMPPEMMPSETSIIRLTPNRFMKAAAKGPIRPNSRKRMARAAEISDALQPNSCCRGTMNTPGAPMVPATVSMVRNVTPRTTSP